MSNLRFTLSAMTLAAFLAGGAAASAGPLAGAAVSDVPHLALRDLGRAPASGVISVALTLNYRNEATLDELVDNQSDPTSPLYKHWLTSDQFARAFGPTAADYGRVIASLQRAGFRVTQTYSNRTVVDASAPVGAAERYFGTQIHRVIQPGFGERYANASPAREPAELRGLIRNVDGLHNLTLVHTFHQRATRQGNPIGVDKAGPPLKGPVNPTYGIAGYGPLAFSQGYDLPNQHVISGTNYYDGTGRASGIVIDADFLDSDLAGFLKYFHVTRTGPATVRVKIDGGPPSGLGSGDSVETQLDVEATVGNAPGTALYVYEFPSFSNLTYITDSYNKVVSDNKVDTANSSFGGCETAFASSAKAWDAVAKQGTALGITFQASSGDNGSSECGSSGVSAPASGPHFVAVGGTTFNVTKKGNYTSESGWGGSGGGVSAVFALPKWQKGVANMIKTGRNVPDISFDADPNTGIAFYYNGGFGSADDPLGGTSLSSPTYGAAQTEINEVEGSRSGLAGKQIFKFFKANGYGTTTTFFHDVTSGGNGGFTAGKGYDQVTGIGSMDAWNYAGGI